MRFTVRLVVAIWISAMVVIAGFTFLQIQQERERLVNDLERRAVLLAEGLKEAIEPAVARGSTSRVEAILKKFGEPRRGLAVYDRFADLMVATRDLAPTLPPALPEVTDAVTKGVVSRGFRSIGDRWTYVYATPLTRDERRLGALAVVLDATHLTTAERDLWRDDAIRFVVLALALSLIVLFVVRGSVSRPMAEISAWTKGLRTGRPVPPPAVPDAGLFGPLAREVSMLARSLQKAQAAAEEEAALRLAGETVWTEERLKQFVNLRLEGRPLVVVSNREPVSHYWKAGKVHAQTPASGLVTAMDPVMRACGGVWVAHASGDADRETADERGRVGVPEDEPRYTLRRVWLSKEEEQGYYYGFANEGLWPLCHIVHTRPTFRPQDFAHYVEVNRKFAVTVLDEIREAEAPLILIQDYHFALLPALVKAERPDARVAIFWHIPWPNFEAFGICPWQRELLLGMLGADLIGFHTQYHCNNFLETVDRALETRIDWEHLAIARSERVTYVKPFPISVAPEFVEDPPPISREDLLRELGVGAEFLGVGVERVDYTKGLPERFRALRWFFERYPEYRERVVFVQLGAPSRSTIKRYQELQLEVEETIREVNAELATRTWRPILYLNRHHEHRDIWPFYRHADFCMVTALHDGMNLVAKEFVSVRDDGDGVLVLSRFTGASYELRDALLVNPYDLAETAEAIRAAVAMEPGERRARMARMRQTVREHNIYRWAGLLLSDLSRIPAETTGAPAS
ncbi:MAG: trehalose-6-phosphate synthase [Candidatus Rokubacteria bacterium]|nr:trehalose-6-phosphate synthase [Candidatus Rokubacteria bacterium]